MLLTDRSITFGSNVDAQYRISKEQVFRKEDGDATIGSIHLKIPGEFNRKNALAAIATAMELGVPFETCKTTLEAFTGIWRRFEHVGVFNDIEVVSDYGHHPTAIASTVQAAKEFYSDRRIVLCYQPHQHARTKTLFKEFVNIFSTLHVPVILAEVYDVAGRNEDQTISSKDIVQAVGLDNVVYAKDLEDAEKIIRDVVKSQDVLIVMGAGDIDEVARKLVYGN